MSLGFNAALGFMLAGFIMWCVESLFEFIGFNGVISLIVSNILFITAAVFFYRSRGEGESVDVALGTNMVAAVVLGLSVLINIIFSVIAVMDVSSSYELPSTQEKQIIKDIGETARFSVMYQKATEGNTYFDDFSNLNKEYNPEYIVFRDFYTKRVTLSATKQLMSYENNIDALSKFLVILPESDIEIKNGTIGGVVTKKTCDYADKVNELSGGKSELYGINCKEFKSGWFLYGEL